MALYSEVGPSHTAALWHIGCGGLLRSASENKFLRVKGSGVLSLVDRDDASVWYVVSRETSLTSEKHVGPRCAVVQCEGPGATLRYMSLHGERPCAKQEPAVVRLGFAGDGKGPGGHCQVGFAQVMHEKTWMSVSKKDGADEVTLAVDVERCSRSECFDFEIAISTVGRGILEASLVKNGSFTSLSGAVSLAVLELSVRFRLRSVHGRVLHRPVVPESASETRADGGSKFVAVF